MDGETLFTRYENNPILTPEKWKCPINAVMNPAAVDFEKKIYLLCRVENKESFSHLTLVKSSNGFDNWEIPSSPTLESVLKYKEEQWGLEDPIIIFLFCAEIFSNCLR